jgi:SAM-dependent methyltransferase
MKWTRRKQRMHDPIPERDARAAEQRRRFFDSVAEEHTRPGPFKRYYGERLRKAFRFNVPRGASVIEIGCGIGDLLAALEPGRGVGVDFSEEMITVARARHPHLEFVIADAEGLALDEKFDFVVLSNAVGDLIDVQRVLSSLRALCHDRTRLVVTDFNYLWGPAVRLAEALGLKPRQREQNWLQLGDLENLLALTGFDAIKSGRDLLLPAPVPVLADIVNDWMSSIPGVSRLTANALIVARPAPAPPARDFKVSVIVACKDERGNIEELVRTVPKMGLGTELIFVDGRSQDGTVEEIERCIARRGELNPALDDVRVLVQRGKGKGDAVRLGFCEARGDVLMILDADITVRSEDLPKFYRALVDGKGEFINGTRLVYPMEDQAMRFLNLLGNHFFGRLFSWLLDQRLTDTLCGTKVLFKRDYERIEAGRAFFGDFDPFGDFDLLFGAAKQNLKICEVPIRYRNREYGEIKIDRFKHGALLLKMSALAFQRFKLLRGVE